MSIEKSSPSPSAKAVTGADSHGRKAGKMTDALGGGGFSAVMNMLSVTDDAAVEPVSITLLTDGSPAAQTDQQSETPVPVDSAGMFALALLTVPWVPSVPAVDSISVPIHASALPQLEIPGLINSTAAKSATAPASVPADLTTSTVPAMATLTETPVAGLAQALAAPMTEASARRLAEASVPGLAQALAVPMAETPTRRLAEMSAPGLAQALAASANESTARPLAMSSGLSNNISSGGQKVKMSDTAAPPMASLRQAANDAIGDSHAVASTAPEAQQVSQVSALLAHRVSMQAHGLQQSQQDRNDTRATVLPQLTDVAADIFTTALGGVAGDLARSQGRFGARSGLGQSGSSGFDSAFGQVMAATQRSEAVFEVPPASAVVAETAVAETVSYWASQGVQTAELELEGFGDSPVEVSIVVNGDQAQIDFRTDQAGVRQVLEAATAQLKELLSSQGLQLSGVSVGTSGKGSEQGSARGSRQGAQQATLVKTETVASASASMTNPAVGRSLDLFV